ncbi:hypothetical protein ACFL54_05490 [Planctomycetota bacterium]
MKASTIRVLIVVLIIGGSFAYRFFFVDSDEVIEFNNALIDMITQSNTRFDNISELEDKYYIGETIDVKNMTLVQEVLADRIQKDLVRLNGIEIPDNELCREFHMSCLNYIENSLKLAGKYAEVIDYISKNNPCKDEEAGFAAIELLTDDLLIKDEKLLDAAIASQEKVA